MLVKPLPIPISWIILYVCREMQMHEKGTRNVSVGSVRPKCPDRPSVNASDSPQSAQV